ncbi:nuclease [Flavobacterium sp. Sd200]|uniref:thermonuclease family protein n=1 Tax=Flavobacterium sp. Sd200 TaxID=2692211 RepID=UPI0013695E7E|nr:thermonuclease family protein [Flavobacterium sp. Sd200]MXN91854.1 nuclease [Flavobacterium sp. Sd200]
MARQKNSKPKYGIVTLIVALALTVFYNYNVKDTAPPPRKYPVEAPAEKAKSKSSKRTKELRDVTEFTGKVVGIKDGDTFEILCDGQAEKVRLADIDCPEKSQPFGNNAKQYASDLCFGQTVTVSCDKKRDRYGRLIGTVVTENGLNVNEALVKAGLAWHYKSYSHRDEFTAYEETARTKHVGLWADKEPTPPWDWRRSRRK